MLQGGRRGGFLQLKAYLYFAGFNPIHTRRCSVQYWLLVTAIFPFAIIMTFLIALWIRFEYKKKVRAGYPFVKGDIRWRPRSANFIVARESHLSKKKQQLILILLLYRALFLYPFLCLFAGIAAGALGIGGGMIK